jgi:hypothetical protein
MKLIETTILEATVRMRYADDPTDPTQWLDFQVKNQNLKLPSGTVITERDAQYLSALKLAALRYVLGAVTAEIDRLRDLQGHRP